MKPSIKLLQERDFGQKVNVTFEFVIQNLKPLMVALLCIAGPAALVAGIFNGIYQSNMFSTLGQNNAGGALSAIAGLNNVFTIPYFLFIVFFLASSVVASLTVYSYILIYEEQGGNTPAIAPAQIWERVQGNLFKYLGFTIALLFLLVVAALFLIIPAIYLGVVFSLIYIVGLRENLGFGDSMRRCFYLITDKWWSTFGLVVVISIIQSIIGYVFQIPTGIFALLKAFQVLDAGSTVVGAIAGVIGTVGQVLSSCLLNTAVVFQYYNLVERREGSGIVGAIDAIGTAETPKIARREEDF
ncbi:MAG: hypothetical protein EAZ70_11260 [Runella slithyformis]|nr:MAG: hypothetical protein EAY79_11550 [Runella slithyformis]TAF24806.1 MAG: hypothetical protein EAZ70_11260 [Runella slithyformis]TAF49649.1 MAG: hypothetical protein EAZ63_00760 [Runella slithyformis]TAF81055.1 MAG: hypothetical protein EAZ50_07375 [Runella slithyformis]